MEGGDLAAWETHRVIIILEGVLVELPEEVNPKRRLRKPKPLPSASDWAWQKQSIKYLNNTARMQSLPVDVVTFTSEEVAEAAAEWFNLYGVEVSSTTYRNFDQFCESLQWSPDVSRVIDSDPLRLRRYGQLGYSTMVGGVF